MFGRYIKYITVSFLVYSILFSICSISFALVLPVILSIFTYFGINIIRLDLGTFDLIFWLILVEENIIGFIFSIYIGFRVIRYKIYGIDCKLDMLFFIVFWACLSSMILIGLSFVMTRVWLAQFNQFYNIFILTFSFWLSFIIFKRSNFMLSELCKKLTRKFDVDKILLIFIIAVALAAAGFIVYLKFFYKI